MFLYRKPSELQVDAFPQRMVVVFMSRKRMCILVSISSPFRIWG